MVPFPPHRLYDYFMGRFKGFSYTIPTGICEIREFTYGVVSEFGCMSIMITSPTDFNTFATKVRNGELSESWNAYIVGASGGELMNV